MFAKIRTLFFPCAGENLVLMLFFPIFLWHSFMIKNRQLILARHFCNESNSCANPRATAHKFLKRLLGLLWIKFGYIYGSSLSFEVFRLRSKWMWKYQAKVRYENRNFWRHALDAFLRSNCHLYS